MPAVYRPLDAYGTNLLVNGIQQRWFDGRHLLKRTVSVGL